MVVMNRRREVRTKAASFTSASGVSACGPFPLDFSSTASMGGRHAAGLLHLAV